MNTTLALLPSPLPRTSHMAGACRFAVSCRQSRVVEWWNTGIIDPGKEKVWPPI
jgi:hypothetical protein